MSGGGRTPQKNLFGESEHNCGDEWVGMPEYHQENQEAVHSVTIHFPSLDDMARFSDILGVTITCKTKGIYFPPTDTKEGDFEYVDET